MSNLGVITQISEIEEIDIEQKRYSGFVIQTDQTNIYALIESDRHCCESYGYFSTNDEFASFVGATLLKIKFTDRALKQKDYVRQIKKEISEDMGGIQFIDCVTTKGTLQFVVYNAHNGAYGHDILVLSGKDILLRMEL